MMNLFELARSVESDVISWRHHIHENPELGGEEFATADFVEERLKEFGVDDLHRVGDTGIVAHIRGAHPGPIFGLRADMDALPVPELTGLPFASKVPGKMHACGHDVHTSVLLGAAKLLCSLRRELHGAVKLFFQPGEENLIGGRLMVEKGELEGPDAPDFVAALHDFPMIPAGKLGIRHGAFNASADFFSVTVKGKQGHGAYPELCIDPIAACGPVISAIQQIVSRELPPQAPAVITIGTIHGGKACNVIAPEVVMEGTIRTQSNEVRAKIFEALPRVVKGTAEALRASADVEIKEGTPVLQNDDAMTDRLLRVATELIGADNIVHIPACSMGGEDFAYYTSRVPGVIFRLGVGREGQENAALHSSYFNPDERAFVTGVAALTALALDVLK